MLTDSRPEPHDSQAPHGGHLRDADLEELRAALDAYDAALLRNDVDELDGWFLDDPRTLRADAAGVLIGHEQISAFRRASPGVSGRHVERIHLVPLSRDAAIAVAETKRTDGTPGLQTQAWVRTDQGWRIAVAHVSAGSAAPPPQNASVQQPDRTVWRTLGDPLVPGAHPGPLDDLSVAVKDIYAVEGHRIGAGNPTWLAQASPEPRHAAAVQALLDAGARITGISQTDEFAYSLAGTNMHYGTPPNPAAPGRITGGSSSGSASAVALGLVDVGLGSDTAGSIRIPASYCGLFGLRPSHGAISTRGLTPLAPSFDTVGWLTRDAETLDRVAHVLLPPSDITPVERILLAEDVLAMAEPAVADVVRLAAARAADCLGVPLDTTSELCHGDMDQWVAAFRTVQAAEAWTVHGSWLGTHLDKLEREIAQRFSDGRAVTASQRVGAERVLLAARQLLWDRLPAGTVLAQPAASTVAPPPDMTPEDKTRMRAGTLRLTSLASVSGLPALTVPGGTVEGRPVGLCLVGSRASDAGLAALARRIV